MTHVLQTSTELSSSPSRQALIKRQQNSGTILTLQSGNLVSDNVSSLLEKKKRPNSWERRQSFGVHCYIPFNTTNIPEDIFRPSTCFIQDSVDSLSTGTHKIQFESHKSSGTSDLQSTPVLNEAGPRIDTQTQAKTVKTTIFIIAPCIL